MAKYTGTAARQRLNSVMANHLVADFAAHGEEVVAKLRKEKPAEYMKLVSAILQSTSPSENPATPPYTVVERQIVRPPAHSDS